jgi:hypothetical protein
VTKEHPDAVAYRRTAWGDLGLREDVLAKLGDQRDLEPAVGASSGSKLDSGRIGKYGRDVRSVAWVASMAASACTICR